MNLYNNKVGDDGMVAFANAIEPTSENPRGALPLLRELRLISNAIGDYGMIAFAEAVRSGALGSLRSLYLQ